MNSVLTYNNWIFIETHLPCIVYIPNYYLLNHVTGCDPNVSYLLHIIYLNLKIFYLKSLYMPYRVRILKIYIFYRTRGVTAQVAY